MHIKPDALRSEYTTNLLHVGSYHPLRRQKPDATDEDRGFHLYVMLLVINWGLLDLEH